MSKTLKELALGTQTFADTSAIDYAAFLRDATGKDLGPLVEGAPGQTGLTVALVGGGVTNVVAAYELARCGVEVTVYERDSSLGGRLKTERGSSDQPSIELGADRFPEPSRVFWHYVLKWARFRCEGTGQDPNAITAEPVPVPFSGDPRTLIGYQNEWFGGQPDLKDRPPVVREAMSMWNSFLIGLNDGYSYPSTRYLPEIRSLARSDSSPDRIRVMLFWQAMRVRYAHKSLGEVLRTEVFTARPDETESLLNAFMTLGHSFVPSQLEVGFLDVLRLLIWYPYEQYSLPSKGDWTQLDYGTSGFVRGLAALAHTESQQWKPRPFAQMFRTDTPVTGVTCDQGTGKVTVRLAGGRAEIFDFVIVAMSTRAMQAIGLDKDIPGSPFHTTAQPHSPTSLAAVQSVQAAIHQLDMMPAYRNVFGIDDPYTVDDWPRNADDRLVTSLLTDRYARQTVILPVVGLGTQTKAVVNALGNDALRLQSQSSRDAHNSFAGSFDPQDAAQSWPQKVVGQVLKESSDVYGVDWNRRRGFGGGFKFDRPGGYYLSSSLFYQYQLANDAVIRPYSRVFLAGDSVAFLGGWVEGSLMTALNATTAVLTQISKQAGKNWRVRSAALLKPPVAEFAWRPIGVTATQLARLRGTSLVVRQAKDLMSPGDWRYEKAGAELCSLTQLAVSQDGSQMLGANADGTLYHRICKDGRWSQLAAMPDQLSGVKDVAITVAAKGPATMRLAGQGLVLIVTRSELLTFRRRVDDQHWSADWETLQDPSGAYFQAKRCAMAVGGPTTKFNLQIAYIRPDSQLWLTTRDADGIVQTPKPAPGPPSWDMLLASEVAIATAYDDSTETTLVAAIDINGKVWIIRRTLSNTWWGPTSIPSPVGRDGKPMLGRRISLVGQARTGVGQLVLQCADGNVYRRPLDYNDPLVGAQWRRFPYPLASPYVLTDLALSRSVTTLGDPDGSVTLWAVGDLR